GAGGKLRQPAAHGVVQAQAAVFGQQQHRGGGELLAHRGQAGIRCRCDRRAGGDIGQADAAAHHRLAIAQHQQGGAGDIPAVGQQPGVDFGHGRVLRGFVRGGGGGSGGEGQDRQQEKGRGADVHAPSLSPIARRELQDGALLFFGRLGTIPQDGHVFGGGGFELSALGGDAFGVGGGLFFLELPAVAFS